MTKKSKNDSRAVEAYLVGLPKAERDALEAGSGRSSKRPFRRWRNESRTERR